MSEIELVRAIKINKMDYAFQISDLMHSSKFLSFIIFVLGLGLVLKLLLYRFKDHFYYNQCMLFGGFVAGYFVTSSRIDPGCFRCLVEINAHVHLLIFLPVVLFNTAFSMDYQGFKKSALQVIFIAFPAFPCQLGLLSSILMAIFSLNDKWTWEVSIIFSIICCLIQSDNVFIELSKTQAHVKHLQLLLQGEQLAILASATYFYTIIFEIYFGTHSTYLFILLILLWHILGAFIGLILGYIFGYIFSKAITKHAPSALTLTAFAAYLSFYIGHIYLHQAGVAVTIVTGVMISPTKFKMSSEIETNISRFWEFLSHIFNSVSFIIPGFLIGLDPFFIDFSGIVIAVIVYIVCWATRSIQYVICRPILNRLGSHLSWADTSIIVVGPYRGAPAFLIAMLYRQYQPFIGLQVLTYTAVLSWTSLTHSCIIPVLLRLFRMYDLTPARAINLEIAISHVQRCGNQASLSLKMDRMNAKTKWSVVNKTTQLSKTNLINHKIEDILQSDFNNFHRSHVADIYGKIIPMETEARALEKEAKHRILNVQLVSFMRQFETGILSKGCKRTLSAYLQSQMEQPDPKFIFNELELSWAPPMFTKKITSFLTSMLEMLPQRNHYLFKERYRNMLMIAFDSLAYRLISTVLVTVETYFIMDFTFREFIDFTISEGVHQRTIEIITFAGYWVFLAEFILLLLTIGCHNYFRCHCNKIDFTCNVILRSVITVSNMSQPTKGKARVFKYAGVLLLLRLNRLHVFAELLIQKLLELFEKYLDSKLVERYEMGKALLIAIDTSVKLLHQIVQDKAIYSKLRMELDDNRKKISKSLGIIQQERPIVAVTIKTKHAIKQVINEMNDCIRSVYDGGFLDDLEKKYLQESIGDGRRTLRSLTVVTPNSPEYIVKSVPWLLDEEDAASFLLNNAKLKNCSYEDIIIEVGEEPQGLFILVSGLVKCYYSPNHETIDNLKRFGGLPNCDFLVNLNLEENQEDYITGNVIGEIGAVTGRRYDMSIVCESEVQVFFIPQYCISKVLFETENWSSVFRKVWRSIGIKIALLILQYEPDFQGWSQEKTLLYLEKSFVPILTGVEELFIDDLVSEILLIEGLAKDANSGTIFYAPYHIPRTTYRLVFPGTSNWPIEVDYQTMLLIVPSKYAEESDIMGRGIKVLPK